MYIVVTVENVNIVHMYVAYIYALRGQGSQDPSLQKYIKEAKRMMYWYKITLKCSHYFLK